MPTNVSNQVEAIRRAVAYIGCCELANTPQSHIDVTRMSSAILRDIRQERVALLEHDTAGDIGEKTRHMAARHLNKEHWQIVFHPVDEPDTSSTMPSTIVRVYDEDGSVEIDEEYG